MNLGPEGQGYLHDVLVVGGNPDTGGGEPERGEGTASGTGCGPILGTVRRFIQPGNIHFEDIPHFELTLTPNLKLK